MEKNLTVGLDIGISSCGFAIIDNTDCKLVEMGVRHFDIAQEAKMRV